MAFDYTNYLANQLLILRNTLGIEQNIVVDDEAIFTKQSNDDLVPDTIYIVVKNLQADITSSGRTQPLQIIVLSEENSMDNAITLMSEFAKAYNWVMTSSDTTYVKQQYSTPIVMNNFQEIGVGFRSVLYLNATLFILENIYEIQNLTIDDEEVEFIQSAFSYNLATDTQQLSMENISTSTKNSSSVSLVLSVVFNSSTYMTKVLQILNGTLTGNDNFEIEFSFDANSTIQVSMNMKLMSAEITSQINDFPTIRLSFIK